MTTSPQEFIARLEAESARLETPCGDGTMAWRRWGSGRPVVLLHGGSGSWRHWIRNIEPLVAAGRQVWAADLPGFGESALPHAPVDFPSISAAIAAGVRALVPGDTGLDIVGFSFGSHTAQYVADALGARVGALVLVNGHIMGPMEVNPSDMLARWRDIEDPAERRDVIAANLAALMFADAANLDALAMHLYEADLARARVRPPKFLNQRDMGLIARLGCRIVNIAGEHDPLGKPSVAAQQEWLLRERPDAEIHMVRGAGHWVAYEAADQFNALLLRTLR